MPIIVSRDGKTAEKVQETGVPDEAYLQGFVANNPDSLPIEDIKENVRLLVVGREFDTASGPIDVLAVDEDGDLYIIETKLYKNPDKRRVIAQMLDYGAALWRQYPDPAVFIGRLDDFMMNRQGQGLSSTASEFLDEESIEIEGFVEKIKSCLTKGGFRFVVLMDRLDERLKDLIIFMNARTDFNIYAVEMEFYSHEGLEIVIPKLFGAEAKMSIAGSKQERHRWDEQSFLRDLAEREGERIADLAKTLMRWVETKTWDVQWGAGKETGTFAPIVHAAGAQIRLFYLTSRGRFYLGPKIFIEKARFEGGKQLEELRRRLNKIPGLELRPEQMRTWTPEISLSILEQPEALALFEETVEWLVGELTILRTDIG